jgi:hypothetical protein
MAFFAASIDVADKSNAMIETGNRTARISASVSKPVPQPASRIFAPRETGSGLFSKY